MKFWAIAAALLLASTMTEAKNWTGSLFPEFKLQNQNGEWVSNEKFGDNWVIYYFYPKNHTPGCSIEAAKFADSYEKFKSMGVEVVGISLDDIESHQSFAKDYKVKFTLLADTEQALSSKLEMVRSFPWPHTSRETLIVDNKGNIIKHYEEVDVNTHVEQIINDLKSLKTELSSLNN